MLFRSLKDQKAVLKRAEAQAGLIETDIAPEAPEQKDDLDDDDKDLLSLDAQCVCRGDMSILFPLGSIRLVRALRNMWKNGLLLVSADKGYVDKCGALGLKEPHLAMHGCISTMVNYHAMQFYANQESGFMLNPTLSDSSIKVTGLVFPGVDQSEQNRSSVRMPTPRRGDHDPFKFTDDMTNFGVVKGILGGMDMLAPAKMATFNVDEDNGVGFRGEFAQMSRAFDEEVNTFGPYDFFSLQLCISDEISAPSPELCLRLLRLSRFDADVFYRFSESFISDDVIRDPLLRRDVAAAIHTTWKNYYALEKDHDVPFQIARFFFLAEEYSRAMQFFDISIRDKGESCSAYFDKGLCLYYMENYLQAVECFHHAIAIDRIVVNKAQEWIERSNQKIADATGELCAETK